MHFEYGRDTHDRPEDMAIRLSDGGNLLDLLWLRHNAVGNAEPSLPPAALPGEPVVSGDHRLVGMWEMHWKQSLGHSRRVREQDPLAVAENTDLWTQPDIGAFANELCVDASEGVGSWREALVFHDAERAVLVDVRTAWARGLRVVLELPLTGLYSRRLSPATLVVSTVTRRDHASYVEALHSFARN